MSKTIQHKRSSVAGNKPNTAQVDVGELGINFADRSIYTKDGSGVITELARDIWRTDTAPDSAQEGDFWYNTSTGEINIWDGTDWNNIGTETGQPVDPNNITADPAFISGTGDSADPYIFDTVYANVGATDIHVANLRITGLNDGQIVEMQDFNSATNGGRYKASNNIADPSGVLNLRVSFDDAPTTLNSTTYSGELKIGGNSIYINGDVVIAEKLDGGTEVPDGVPDGVGGSGPFIWQGGDTTLTATYPLEISDDGFFFTDRITVTNGQQFWLQWAGDPGSGDGIDGAHGTTISGAVTDGLGGAQFFYFTIDKETGFVFHIFVDSDQTIGGLSESRVVTVRDVNSYVYPFGTTTGDSAQYAVNGGDWSDMPATNAGSATHYMVEGDEFQLRHRDAATINTASTYNFNMAGDSADWTTVTADVVPVIKQPTIESPATDNEIGISTTGPFVSSDFEMASGVDTHTASSWEIVSFTAESQSGLKTLLGGDTHNLKACAHNGSVFCVLAQSKTSGNPSLCATSPDGVTWTNQTGFTGFTKVDGLTWVEDLSIFIAFGQSSSSIAHCATSPDGITWTDSMSSSYKSALSNKQFASVAWTGTNLVVIGGYSACATSPDGITWTKTGPADLTGSQTLAIALKESMDIPVSGAALSPKSVIYNPNAPAGYKLLVVAPDGQLARCSDANGTDAVTWLGIKRLYKLNISNPQFYHLVASSEGHLLAFGGGGQVCSGGKDGSNWTQVTTSPHGISGGDQAVIWSETLKKFVTAGPSGILQTTTDGLSWNSIQVKDDTGKNLSTMNSIAESTTQVYSVGNEGSSITSKEVIDASLDSDTSALTSWSPTGLDYETDYTVKVKHHTATLNSEWSKGRSFTTQVAPGVNWTLQTGLASATSNNTMRGIVWTGSQFLTLGDTGKAATSPDGVTWTSQSGLASMVGNKDMYAIEWNGSLFMAVGKFGAGTYSSDGVTWNASGVNAYVDSNDLNAIVWNGSVFCVVGNSGSCATSPDGVNWTKRASLASEVGTTNMYDIAWNGSVFCAVGNSSKCATSPDGVTWTEQTSLLTELSSSNMYTIAWNGSVFCAAGADGYCATSPDGVTWTRIPGTAITAFSSSSSNANDMVWAGSQFCVVGDIGVCATSPDGVTWTEQSGLAATSTPMGSGHMYAIAWDGSQLCAVGDTSKCVTS